MGKEKKHRRNRRLELPSELREPADLFLHRQKDLGKDPKTVTSIRSNLDVFLEYLDDSGITRMQDVTPDVIDEFIPSTIKSGYSNHSIEGQVSAARRLMQWMADELMIFNNPATGWLFRNPAKHKLGLVLSVEQVHELLNLPDISTLLGRRDKAMLETFYSAGMRLSECCGLKTGSINLDNGTALVFGKGSKERVVPLGKHAVYALRDYITCVRPVLITRRKGNIAGEALWLSNTGGPLLHTSVVPLVQRYVRASSLPREADSHTLRRSCATHLLQSGAHPAVVADILGHKDLRTLSHYLKTTITDLKETHKRTNPGA
jgi:integrase/recombinase XerD